MQRKTGARGLRTILENVLLDTMYELPSMRNVAQGRGRRDRDRRRRPSPTSSIESEDEPRLRRASSIETVASGVGIARTRSLVAARVVETRGSQPHFPLTTTP